MNKENFLHPKIEEVLVKIDFINKYDSLAQKHTQREENFIINNQKVLDVCHLFDRKFKYSKAKEFYMDERIGNFKFTFSFFIRFQSFDFGLSIHNKYLGIDSSAPFDFWVKLMTYDTKKINRIMFKNYEDIQEILKGIIDIYNDIKNEVIKLV